MLVTCLGVDGLAVKTISAAEAQDQPAVQATALTMEQESRYIPDLNYYLSNIDKMIGAPTIKAVKEIQNYYNSAPEDTVSEPATSSNQLGYPNDPDQMSYITPSRSGRSRESLYNYRQDIECLARTVYGEARGESFEGQVAVAAVVLNRLESGNYGSSIREVVFQRGAFTAVRDGQYYLQPNESAYAAAQEALNGSDPTNGALYYWNPRIATSRWVRTRTIIGSIGNHVFAV